MLKYWVTLLLLFPLCVFAKPALTFSCSETNDLFHVLHSNGQRFPRFANADEAVENAKPNSAVLILADGYPATRTPVTSKALERARAKNVRLYVEYPQALPGISLGEPRGITWERTIVTGKQFGATLAPMRILAIQGCQFLPAKADAPWMVVGRVAGFDTAVYGLPKETFPVLFEADRNLLVATTKLSHFVTARYAPTEAWKTVWQTVLQKLSETDFRFDLEHRAVVEPAFAAKERLPGNIEKEAIQEGAAWILRSQLLLTEARYPEVEKALAEGKETVPIPANKESGDGRYGILEGYEAAIQHDGRQRQRLPLRADCNTESAMVLAVQDWVSGDRKAEQVAENLLDYVYFKSDMCRDERADPKHGAYGLIGWGAVAPAWRVANYGDDNARVLQATILAAACLKSGKWNEAIAKGILANFRTTGRLGFRGDRIDNPSLAAGWKQFHNAEPVNISPHFESGLWACYLWAYRETGYKPLLERTKTGIAMTMDKCPDGWRWGDNNVERARMLLPLAWLVRIEDTPQHRQWLKTVADGLLKHQQGNGAIREWVTSGANSHYHFPASNEAYGTSETPLIQENGDPASDQLYTTGFALLGLHEAYAATRDARYKQAEDKLAEFLCRIQTSSKQHDWLDGWWFRAFDDRRWDYWASSADMGWGAWSLETGWAQAWTVAALGLREKKTTFWESTRNADFAKTFQKFEKEMLQ